MSMKDMNIDNFYFFSGTEFLPYFFRVEFIPQWGGGAFGQNIYPWFILIGLTIYAQCVNNIFYWLNWLWVDVSDIKSFPLSKTKQGMWFSLFYTYCVIDNKDSQRKRIEDMRNSLLYTFISARMLGFIANWYH